MSAPAGQDLGTAGSREAGISARTATQLEYAIIALGISGLVLIFQPFSLALFGYGCALVVAGGLINNLLPLCRSGVPMRTIAIGGLVVADIFCVMLLLAIAAAHLYGRLFVAATTPDTADPFYLQPFVWGVGFVAALLAAAIWSLRAGKRGDT